MIDVAVVAEALLRECMPLALQRRLLDPLGLPDLDGVRLLTWIIALHDFGKATPAFQAKAELGCLAKVGGLPFDVRPTDSDHGRIGLALLVRAIKEQLGALALPLARAVVAHHGVFPTDSELDASERQIGRDPWPDVQRQILREISHVFPLAALPTGALAQDRTWFVLLAGVTCIADWVGSMIEYFPYQAPGQPLPEYAVESRLRAKLALQSIGMVGSSAGTGRSFHDLFPGFSPWPLHEVADRVAQSIHEPTLVVVEAPMGEGKTEAALTIAEAARASVGCSGLFIGLPTKATANQMFARVNRYLQHVRRDETPQLVLAHAEASLVEDFRKLVRAVYDPESGGDVRAGSWFLRSKRALLASHAVGTVDQALMGVLRVRHGFVRLTGLAGKVVVLDEVHAYDTFTSTLLDRLVEWLAAMGSTVVLLSATLPSNRRSQLIDAWRKGCGNTARTEGSTGPYPRLTVCGRSAVEHRTFSPRSAPFEVAIDRESDDVPSLVTCMLERLRDGGCGGWICNTVGRAQTVMRSVRAAAPELPTLLIHARMLPEERQRREKDLVAWLGREGDRPHRCLVIGTQVLEQSLDIDFDWLRSDVAPMDLLLQRAGRLHRHRRSARPVAHRAPRLSVVMPDGHWHEAELDRVARVYITYGEWIMRRTLRLLEGRHVVRLPSEIEPLIEAAYVQADPPEAAMLMAAFQEERRSTMAAHEVAAKKELLPSPDDPDDFLSALQPEVRDDEDPELHKSLRAVTRLGPPTVDAVCLHAHDGRLFLDRDLATAVDLEEQPTRIMVDQLVRHTIGITRPDVVAALLAERTPDAWRDQSLLRFRRPLVFTNATAEVGHARLRLDDELGLVIESRPR